MNQQAGRLAAGIAACIMLLCWLAGCGGGNAVRNSYPEADPGRSLPEPSDPLLRDWMQQRMSVDGTELELNYSEATFSLDVTRPGDDEVELSALLTELYPDMASAIHAADESDEDVLPSIDMLDVFQKYTDDRVLAALELELSTGDLVYPGGKQQWLRDLLAAVPADDDNARQSARAFIGAALLLGGGSTVGDPREDSLANSVISRFKRDRLRSTVIGFYTGSEELSRIFLRDRLLQTRFSADMASGLLGQGSGRTELAMLQEIDDALSTSISLRDAYNDFLALQSIVTNPAASSSLNELPPAGQEDLLQGSYAVFPHSLSLEEQLFTGMGPGNPMEYLKQSLEDGSVDLQPGADSGWYGYQQYALETLLLPERADEFAKLRMSGSYIARLEQAFEATITQRRETQAKNLAAGVTAAVPLEEQPLLHLEPAPTVYLRTARAYRFLLENLQSLPGSSGAGESYDWLLDELAAAARRYYAMHCLSCHDIGLMLGINPQELDTLELPGNDQVEETDWIGVAQDPRFNAEQRSMIASLIREARSWLGHALDTDRQQAASIYYDPRVCVPAAIEPDGSVHNWGVIGVRLLQLEHRLLEYPKVEGIDPEQQQDMQAFVDGVLDRRERKLIPVYEYVDFSTAAPLSREQFRDWCDQSRSREEFRLVVNAYGGSVGRSWLEQYGVWIVVLICIALFRDRLFPGIFGPKKAAAEKVGDGPGDDAGKG